MQKWLQKIFLLLAVVTVMGHNVLPHHHHEEILSKVSHHHHDEGTGHHHQDDDKDDSEKDGDSSPFSDYSHSPEFGKVVTKPVNFDEISLKAPVAFIVLQAYVLSFGSERLPVIRPPIENSSFSSSVYCYCLPLRAPPALA